MHPTVEEKLIHCLDALEAGEAPVDILARHPEAADHLRPMLEMATQLADLSPEPSPAAQKASRDAFLAGAARMRRAPQPRPVRATRSRHFLRLVTLTALILLLSLTGIMVVAQRALPGDGLYTLKLTTEMARLGLIQDADDRDRLEKQFDYRRVAEVLALLESGRQAQVSFGGDLEQFDPDVWHVRRREMAVKVYITEDTRIEGAPHLGRYVHVEGWTAEGVLYARELIVSNREDPDAHQHSETPAEGSGTSP